MSTLDTDLAQITLEHVDSPDEQSTASLPIYEDPTAVVERAAAWARALMNVVEAGGYAIAIGQKKYLTVEGWQVVGMFAQAHAVPLAPTPEYGTNGDIVGYNCVAQLWQHGIVVGQGMAFCGLDAFASAGRRGSDRNKAAISCAQTWAVSKAYRNRFSFVAKLGGLEPTPYEEMEDRDSNASAAPDLSGAPRVSTPRPSQTDFDDSLTCPHHSGVQWFKRGHMVGFAHPIDGTDPTQWCNRDDFRGRGGALQPGVLTNLGDSLDMIMRVHQYSDDDRAATLVEWATLTPTQQQEKLELLRANFVEGGVVEGNAYEIDT